MSYPSEFDQHPKSTAYHEAGHVFMHEVFEKKYDYVSIAKPGEEGVKYSYPDPNRGSPVTLEQLIFACICFAGHAAEDRLNFVPDAPRENIGVNVGKGAGEPTSDYEKFKALSLPLGALDQLLDFTVDIIIDNWNQVSEIGESLYQKKLLQPEEVKNLLQHENWADRPGDYIEQLRRIKERLNNK